MNKHEIEIRTPRPKFELSFHDIVGDSKKFTRRHVILLSTEYGISRQACVLRLEHLGIIKRGSWDWFKANGGITNKQAAEVLSASPNQKN